MHCEFSGVACIRLMLGLTCKGRWLSGSDISMSETKSFLLEDAPSGGGEGEREAMGDISKCGTYGDRGTDDWGGDDAGLRLASPISDISRRYLDMSARWSTILSSFSVSSGSNPPLRCVTGCVVGAIIGSIVVWAYDKG